MGSNVRGFVPDLNLYLPIFEKASKLNIPICLHPTVPSRAPAYLDEELNTAVSWMFDTTFTLAKLLVGGLLEKVPDLKLVAHHLGGATLALLGRIDYYLKTDLKVKAILTKPPSEYYKQVYYDTLCHNVTQTTFAYSVFKTNKLLFASDSPFHSDISECLKTIELADIPEEGKKKILEDNARELFGI
jgi:aminocarboxymuconate-semialdehyde decarboxylase